MWLIGSDGGYLRAPVRLKQLLLAPAARADVIVEFASLRPGATVTLRNVGPDEPYNGDDDEAADPRTTGQVMQFRADRRLTSPDPTTRPSQLVMPEIAALQGGAQRALALLEASTLTADGKEIPIETTLGVIDPAVGLPKGVKAVAWHDPISENPSAGDIETWALYNFTEDAHPIHVHHVLFQLIDRQRFDKKTGALIGKTRPPRPEENGWKDTVIAFPKEVTRIRMKFGKNGQFVWHCHMLEHEDNDMMRPFRIGPAQAGQPA
jgi:FtsP/CotA-like multicopper oxidase with cupredoxin domain